MHFQNPKHFESFDYLMSNARLSSIHPSVGTWYHIIYVRRSVFATTWATRGVWSQIVATMNDKPETRWPIQHLCSEVRRNGFLWRLLDQLFDLWCLSFEWHSDIVTWRIGAARAWIMHKSMSESQPMRGMCRWQKDQPEECHEVVVQCYALVRLKHLKRCGSCTFWSLWHLRGAELWNLFIFRAWPGQVNIGTAIHRLAKHNWLTSMHFELSLNLIRFTWVDSLGLKAYKWRERSFSTFALRWNGLDKGDVWLQTSYQIPKSQSKTNEQI